MLAGVKFSIFYMDELELLAHIVVSFHYALPKFLYLAIICQFFIIFVSFLLIFHLFGTVYVGMEYINHLVLMNY